MKTFFVLIAGILLMPCISRAGAIVSPSSGSITIIATSVGTSSAQAAPAAPNRLALLAIDDESTSASIACAFGSAPALNSAGSFTIPPGGTRVWNGFFVPTDPINCIASAASTPVTIERDQAQ